MAYAQPAELPASKLLAMATAYCQRENVRESMFGRHVASDPRLIGDLRRGRQPGERLTRRVLAFIEGASA